jgi:hypothetical protein
MENLTSQEQIVQVSTITESSFISAFDPKCGILPNLNGKPKNGVLLFSDFSNFLALTPEVRSKLQAQIQIQERERILQVRHGCQIGYQIFKLFLAVRKKRTIFIQ